MFLLVPCTALVIGCILLAGLVGCVSYLSLPGTKKQGTHPVLRGRDAAIALPCPDAQTAPGIFPHPLPIPRFLASPTHPGAGPRGINRERAERFQNGPRLNAATSTRWVHQPNREVCVSLTRANAGRGQAGRPRNCHPSAYYPTGTVEVSLGTNWESSKSRGQPGQSGADPMRNGRPKREPSPGAAPPRIAIHLCGKQPPVLSVPWRSRQYSRSHRSPPTSR